MSLHFDSGMDSLALVVGAVRENPELQKWFQSIANLSDNGRRDAVVRVVQLMRANQESEEIIAAVGLLAHPELFEAALITLHELGIIVFQKK